MDSVLSNEVARRIAADLATLVSEAEKHGTLPRIKSVAFYFNETELRTIIKLLRSCHGILDPAQPTRESVYHAVGAKMLALGFSPTEGQTIAIVDAALAAQPPAAPVEPTCPGGIDPGFEECPKCGATDEEECRGAPRSSADSAKGLSEPLQCLRCGTIDAFGPISKKDAPNG